MDLSELVKLDIRKLRAAYAKKTVSPPEVMQATLAQAERVNKDINALFHVVADQAMAEARASESRWQRGETLGSLDGVPVTVKDSVTVVGWPYFHGARPNRDRPMSTDDAPPAARLKETGAIIFAKTVMPDCGLMSSGLSSSHGVVRNPWRLSANTGGSSAGAGASLAACIGFGSVGSDIAGSVRQPASHCGLAALKPTQGQIPHLPCDIMRTAGPMARSVSDVAAVLSVIAGGDSRDRWSLPAGMNGYEDKLERDLSGLRIGILLDMGFDPRPTPEVVAVVQTAAERLAGLGADLTDVAAPFDFDAYEPIDRVFQVRGYAEIETFAPERRDEITPAVLQWCQPAKDYSALDYVGFLKRIDTNSARLEAHLRSYDYVVSPVSPVVNFDAEAAGLKPETPLGHTNFTALFNQTTQPAAVVHQALVDGLPVGVQIVGKRFDDLGVLQIAKALEDARGTVDWPLTPRA